MDELKYLANWVKEQHAQEYILTWLLNQPGLWWSDGEAYQAALQKSGKLLKEYVQKNQTGDLFQGIAEKIVDDENWDEVAESLTRIISVYQDELLRLQDYSRRKNSRHILKKNINSDNLSVKNYDKDNEEMEIQQALPDPFTDALTGEV
ncbi:hypothetical protein Tery_2844 [Trichodesmium erythraeum IMS101]|uniref:Uncharacterized protein n=1 Tax=Trichodesmium erythraeum (strain IMS101) TaxID=203124 RepID=Q110Q6_TRIEI|nr:hypothetical protein [Trichodesmium erythraeum GBRTRLIN201]MCH2050098.1 hypothetical protein [Trichodesmium sp. ALOHA_ZT_67]MCL2927930.1 hypothetical protein [Trichodesmium sp. MAG_R01]MDE5067886.1 hypothetical protein [Trichodesmium sp. St4_bin8_1]MDE5074242.1 hypothetical protein [Trichodesmium sp. St5_bin8]MDE5103974.1 hypothetical protein [Trichodesmium sp. St19_bin2]MDT9338058.1 hypothetical protein [Trichodesmium erythraeum 21-75]